MLSYNPQQESAERLEGLTCGKHRHALIERLLIELEGDLDAAGHQHHLIVGPRGSGKTHLLRVLVAARLARSQRLQGGYRPVVLPEEVALRSPADLPVRILERLAADLAAERSAVDTGGSAARAACLEALRAARSLPSPLDRLRRGHDGLVAAGEALGQVLLPVVENLDSVLFLGGAKGRSKRHSEHWGLRSHLQESTHLLLVASAASYFGAVANEDAPFYEFFRIHRLAELHNDECLEIIRRRLEEEAVQSVAGDERGRRVRALLARFGSYSAELRGQLAIAGGLPRFAHMIYDVLVEADVTRAEDVLNRFLDDLTPYFQQRLDPRLMPEAEIDLLHELASSWGPLQPSELAERMYGVSCNEVGVLLGRLQDRGLVMRSGHPGGRAVTWDLTEPLYRVWTLFRTGSGIEQRFLLLARFVALLYTADELTAERIRVASRLAELPGDAGTTQRLQTRLRFLNQALELQLASQRQLESTAAVSRHDSTEPATVEHAGTTEEEVQAIFDRLDQANEQDDSTLTLEALEDLRCLAERSDISIPVQVVLAFGLVIQLMYANKDEEFSRRDQLLDGLRDLAQQWPEDTEVRKLLTRGLFNTLNNVKEEGDLVRRDQLLDELRDLARRCPEDTEVRRGLAMGLFNTINDTKEEGDLARCDQLLDELRDLAQQWPEDAEVRKRLTMGLFNTLNNVKGEGDLVRRDQLLDELRDLFRGWPEDHEVRKQLTKGLLNTLYYAKEEGDLARGYRLLDELRGLVQRWPEDTEVREVLAMGLFNILYDAKEEGDLVRRDQLIDELRFLARQWPEDFAVREQLALGLGVVLSDAGRGDLDAECLLTELAALVRSWPVEALASLVNIGALLLSTGDVQAVRQVFEPLSATQDGTSAALVRLLLLAADVLERGEEVALAREPQEMRRVVAMLLERAGRLSDATGACRTSLVASPQ